MSHSIFEVRPVSDAFNSSPATVGELLSTAASARSRVIVPPFQRGYMWKKKHIEAFWDDVDRQRQQSRRPGSDPHFFGPIVTLSKPTDRSMWLLDGQQRLATATILFSVLRNVGREIGKVGSIQAGGDFAATLQLQFICSEDAVYSIELGEADRFYFRETVQQDPPRLDAKITQTTHRNIKAAISILTEKVVTLVGPITPAMDTLQAIALLKELKTTIVSDLIMARIPVLSEEAAFKIFTTLNDRGLKLSPPDLLLSYLMEKARPEDRSDIRAIWTQLLQKMGNNDMEDFLRAMWVSKYGDLKDDLFVALKRYIEENKADSLVYAMECLEECDDYLAVWTADETQLDKDSVPVVRAITRELTIKAAVPLLLSAFSRLTASDFQQLARFILVFVTRYSIIGNRNTAGMENLFFKLAREIRQLVPTAKDSKDSQQALKQVKESLAANTPDDEAVIKSVQDPSTLLDHAEARYVVMRVARLMQDREKQTMPSHETNLEHIYPQSPKENEWGGPANQEIMNPWLEHIGNLTIYGIRANRKVANAEFVAVKRAKYLASKIEMTKDIAVRHSVWDVQSIQARAAEMAKLVAELWRYENPSYV